MDRAVTSLSSKPIRSTILPRVAGVAVAVLAAILPAAGVSAVDLRDGSSGGCHSKYDPELRSSWGCARISGPEDGTITAGRPTTIKLRFQARRTLTNLKLCITHPDTGRCVYTSTVKRMNKGRVVNRTVVITIAPRPGAAAYGTRVVATVIRRGHYEWHARGVFDVEQAE